MTSSSRLSVLAFFIIGLFVFSSCKSDADKSELATKDNTNIVIEDVIEIYAVNRANFRIRDKPSMTVAKKVGLVSYGDFLLYLDEKSSERTPVQLGMMTYNEPFYKVKDLGSDTTEGWIHGSGMIRIFKGGKSNYPNFDNLKEFGRFLGELPFGKLKSSQKALEKVKNLLLTASPSTADALYIMLHDFLNRNDQEGNFYKMAEGKFEPTRKEWEAIFHGTFDMSQIPSLKSLADAGYRLNTSEGMLFPTIDCSKLDALFSPKTTASMKGYLRLQTEIDQNRETEDAGIVMDLNTLADRAIAKENFAKQNPNFPIKTAFSDAQWTQFLLVCGTDNTPIYDWESKKVRKEVKENWAYILAKYPDSDLAEVIKERKLSIAAEGNIVTEKAQEYCGDMAQEIW